MPIIKNDINNEKYKELIQYICNNSNIMVFTISTYDYIEDNTRSGEYKEYVKNMDNLMDKLKPYILKKINTPLNFLQMELENDSDFCEEWENEKYLYDIYLFKISKVLTEVLKNIDGLNAWKKPNLPQDLMFITDDYIKLSVTSHEESVYIYCESEKEYLMFKKMGIEFYEKYDKEYEETVKNSSKKLVNNMKFAN